jgi:hypothetical protein
MGAGQQNDDERQFDHQTIELMRSSLEDGWARLPPAEQAGTSKTLLAQRILTAVARGERDPARLRLCALLHIDATSHKKAHV